MFTFYDDELHNLILVADKSIKQIISYLSTYDYHPPLQYLLNKFCLELFGLNEFWLKAPSILFIFLSILLCSRIVYKITGSSKAGLLCGFISIANPLILLWGSSLRWYPLWTFLSVLSFYLTLLLLNNSRKSGKIKIQILLAITLALSLYTNYQSILVIIALLVSVFILDLKEKDRKYIFLKKLIPAILAAVILFLPYIGSFENHLNTFLQQNQNNKVLSQSSPLLSGGYYIFSVLFGNSIYPWDIKFIIPFLILVITSASIFFLKTDTLKNSLSEIKSGILGNNKITTYLLNIFSITLFILFLVQAAISKTLSARGFIIIPLLLVTTGCVFISGVKKIKGSRLNSRILIVTLSLLFIWLIGSYNVITRQSIHKTSLMNPVVEVTSILDKTISATGDEYIIINYDPVLTYYLLKDKSLDGSEIISPYAEEIKNLLSSFNEIDYSESKKNNPGANLIYIQGFLGSLIPVKDKLDSLTSYIINEGIQFKNSVELGYDSDSAIKRKFFPNSEITDYRYNMMFLKPKTEWDYNILSAFFDLKGE